MRGVLLAAISVIARAAGLTYAARQLRRAVASALLLIGAALVLGAIAACLVVSLWIYVLPLVGPAGAPLVVAGCLLPLALALLLGARQLSKPPRAQAAPAQTAPAAAAASLASVAIASFMAGLLRDRP
jgi:hypothetical protein